MLLKDQKLNKQLQKDGFVIVPFLSKDELKNLNHFYEDVHKGAEPPDFIEDIHMTIWCSNQEYKQRVSHELSNLVERGHQQYFQNTRRLNHVFIVKRSGSNTTFKVHQDWNVVNENLYESVNVWVPLHDVDENNGALWVIKGSHRIKRKIRGAGYLFPDYTPFLKELEEKAISVKLKAGEAIIFYHSIIHGSPPNLGLNHRKALCFTVIPQNAPLSIYYQPSPTDQLQLHQPADDFMFHYHHLRTESVIMPPTDKATEILPPYVNSKVTINELNAFLKPSGILQSLFSRFT